MHSLRLFSMQQDGTIVSFLLVRHSELLLLLRGMSSVLPDKKYMILHV